MLGPSQWRRRRRTDTRAALGVVAAAVALAGAAWYCYTRRNQQSGNSKSTSASKNGGDAKAQLARRPTVSLVLPPSLSLQYQHTRCALSTLLSSLAPLYLVHLIHNAPQEVSWEQQAASKRTVDELSQIEGVDVRRFLAYETPQGAEAVARALGCDMHVEALIDNFASVASQRKTEDVLRRSQALALIRRNGKCHLFVVLLLPGPTAVDRPKDTAAYTTLGSSHLIDSNTPDELVSSLLNGSNNATASGLAMLRILDVRSKRGERASIGSSGELSAAGDLQPQINSLKDAIEEATRRLADFRSGWK